MSLHDYALTTLESLKRSMRITDSDIQIPIMTIYNSSTDATAATVEITDTYMHLIVTGGVNAHNTQLLFADTDKDTMSELITAINALSKGWVVNLLQNGSQDSDDLTVIEATNALLKANQQTLNAPNNLLLEELINRMTDLMEDYCGRRFKKTTYTDLLVDGNGSEFLFLKNFPINSVTSIYRHYLVGDDDELDSDYYVIYSAEGYIYREAGFVKGHQNYKITYDAGYDFDNDGIPAGLQLLCNKICTFEYNSYSRVGIKSEKIGSYSVTYDVVNILPVELLEQLDMWRRRDGFYVVR